MGWKGDLAEYLPWALSKIRPALRQQPENPGKILVLRNNDIGDLLTTTPLFEALRRRYPNAEIVAGVGHWNVDTIKHNPFVNRVVVVNAPWHNKFMSPQSKWKSYRYVFGSEEVARLRQEKFNIGIDIVGSHFGALLMLQARIPYRLGVKGYNGGHSAAQQTYAYDKMEHVSRAAMHNAELLGVADLPEARPQIFLSAEEQEYGEAAWREITGGRRTLRVIISPGGGATQKNWPIDRFAAVSQELLDQTDAAIISTGGKKEVELANQITGPSDRVRNLAGKTSLRQAFAITAACDVVLTNSSMQMHVAAAFRKPALVLLGDWAYFGHAKDHAKQWSYPEQVNKGREIDVPHICTVEDAVREALALCAAATRSVRENAPGVSS